MKISLKTFFVLLFVANLSLLIAYKSSALTVVNKYVDTDCSNNGDGTSASCAASPGAAGAYTTLSNALSDIVTDTPDFVSSDIQVNINCEGTAVDTTAVDIQSLTLDATRYLAIIGNRTTGTWSTSHYRIAASSNFAVIRIKIPNVRLSYLQIEQTKTGAGPGTESNGVSIDVASGSGSIFIDQNILRYTGDYTNQEPYVIRDLLSGATNINKIYRNNIGYDFKNGFHSATAANDDVYTYNNTCYSNVAGGICFVVRGNGAGATLNSHNNLANGSAAGWNIDATVSTWNHNNNLSEDTTSPDNTWDSQAVNFANEGSDDFHLNAGDTAAKNQGADLSAATNGMSIDVDGATRSGTWDIGADEQGADAGTTTTTSTTTFPAVTKGVVFNSEFNRGFNGGLN